MRGVVAGGEGDAQPFDGPGAREDRSDALVAAARAAVAGAGVTARGAFDPPPTDLVLTATCDAEGRFHIRGLEGDVIAVATAPGLDGRAAPEHASAGGDGRIVMDAERLD